MWRCLEHLWVDDSVSLNVELLPTVAGSWKYPVVMTTSHHRPRDHDSIMVGGRTIIAMTTRMRRLCWRRSWQARQVDRLHRGEQRRNNAGHRRSTRHVSQCYFDREYLSLSLCHCCFSYSYVKLFVMVALCNRADHYIFALWFLSFFLLSFFVALNRQGDHNVGHLVSFVLLN